MLLVELTVGVNVRYVSIDGHALTHNWKPRIIGFDAPTLAIPTNHGGYCKMEFGNIVFNPVLFYDAVASINDWPPPVSCPIGIYYTDTTEAARETIFVGTAHLASFDRTSVTYRLFGADYDETIAASTAYNDTLNVIMTTILTTIAEITTVNTDYARASSPNVTHTTTAEVNAIDLASAIAAFYSHLFYVVGTTAYLVDMKLDNGTDWTLTEFKYFASAKYYRNVPLSSIESSQYKVFSAYPYGTETTVDAYHTTEANITTAITDILAIENAARITVDVPMIAGNFPRPGQAVILPDTAHVADLSSWVRARKLQFNFLTDRITIDGDGEVAAG